jgi:hypothetical protein
VKKALVQALALPDREDLEVVVVVAHESDSRVNGLSVDREVLAAGMTGEEQQCAELRERVAPSAVVLAAVDELRIGADRDVVEEEPLADAPDVDPSLHSFEGIERGGRVVTVEPEVTGKVVPGAERHADELQIPLDRRLRESRQRAVAAGDPDRARGAPSQLGAIVVVAEDSRLDPAVPGFLGELFRARAFAARARIDEKQD